MKFKKSSFSGATIIITRHAKERLFERFPELCKCRKGFTDILHNAVKNSELIDANVEGSDIVLKVIHDDIAMVLKGHPRKISVATCIQSVLWEEIQGNKRYVRKVKKYRKKRVEQLAGVSNV